MGAQLVLVIFALHRGQSKGAHALFCLVFPKPPTVPAFDLLEDFSFALRGVPPHIEAGSELFIQALDDGSEIAGHLIKAAKDDTLPVRHEPLMEANPGKQSGPC